MVQTDCFRKDFTIHLTDEEIVKRAKHLAGIGDEIRALTAEMKEETKERKDKIASLKVTARELETIITAGAEEQAVDCFWRAQEGKPFMDLVRMDTMLVVTTRAMSPDEEREAFPQAEQTALDEKATAAVEEEKADEKVAAGGGHDGEQQPKKTIALCFCPAIVDGPSGKTCGAEGSRRARGFCKAHQESLTAEEKAAALIQ